MSKPKTREEKIKIRIRHEERRRKVDVTSEEVAQAIARNGGYTIAKVRDKSNQNPKLDKSIQLCLLNRYGIEKMENWLGEEHKDVMVFIPAAFGEERRANVKKKVEKILTSKVEVEVEDPSIDQIIEKLGEITAAAIFLGGL